MKKVETGGMGPHLVADEYRSDFYRSMCCVQYNHTCYIIWILVGALYFVSPDARSFVCPPVLYTVFLVAV